MYIGIVGTTLSRLSRPNYLITMGFSAQRNAFVLAQQDIAETPPTK